MNAEAKAPGCYGSPTMFAMNSKFCQKCVAYDECGPVAHATIAQLANVVDVTDLIKQHEQARKKVQKPSEVVTELIEAPAGTLPNLPMQLTRKPERVKFDVAPEVERLIETIKNGKAKAQALALARANMVEPSIEALAQGRNPFEDKPPKFLKVACDRLLLGGFTKPDLKASFMTTLGHTASAAASHVSIAVAVLGAFRITQQDGRRIVLNPALTR